MITKPWEPILQEDFSYSSHLMAQLLYWRLEELNDKGLKAVVLGRVELWDLSLYQQCIDNAAETGYAMAVVPLKLLNKTLQIRKRHLLLALQHGIYDMYWKQKRY